jgi:hypothetical protein
MQISLTESEQQKIQIKNLESEIEHIKSDFIIMKEIAIKSLQRELEHIKNN